MNDVVLSIRGRPMTLSEVAAYAELPYKIIHKRYYKSYIRSEDIMEWPDRFTPRTLDDVTTREIKGLSETRAAWIGMKDGWKLACDLLGIPHREAKELRYAAERIWA